MTQQEIGLNYLHIFPVARIVVIESPNWLNTAAKRATCSGGNDLEIAQERVETNVTSSHEFKTNTSV